MTPQQLKESLWNCYAHIENMSLESNRTTQEMVQGKQVETYLAQALDAIGRSIYLLNDEYFQKSVENFQETYE